MKFYQRVAQVIAEEGMAGFWPRVFNRLTGSKQKLTGSKQKEYDNTKDAEEYQRLVDQFRRRSQGLTVDGLDRFYWYHTIDLGNGLVTPGTYDYRSKIKRFGFLDGMSGIRVLDIGSATGYFAFEFEKRGADVTSVELPSIADWDMPPGEDKQKTLNELMESHKAKDIEEVHYLHLDGPFQFCHKILNSKIKRHYSTIYDLHLEELG